MIENHIPADIDAEFVQQYRKLNEDVQLDHIEIKSDKRQGQTPMICVHGMFDSRLSFKQICEKEDVLAKRDCYLVGTRNHAFSDHHDDMYYTAMADDIIRFADKQGLDTFTLMGHSMGGKIVMTAACLYPDRVNGVIALDAAPWNWNRFLS